MKKVTHCGYGASNGKLMCGKRAALLDSTLNDSEITCLSCLGQLQAEARQARIDHEAQGRNCAAVERHIVELIRKVRYGG